MSPPAGKWLLAAAIILAVVLVGLAVSSFDCDQMSDALEHFGKRPAEAVVVRPTVLLVSAQEKDRYLVQSTVEPRGYDLEVTDSVDEGKKILDRQRDQITVVLVDAALPGAKQLIQASKAHCPRAHLVELRGYREAAQVSAMLVDKVLY
jgi:hypothetical protein